MARASGGGGSGLCLGQVQGFTVQGSHLQPQNSMKDPYQHYCGVVVLFYSRMQGLREGKLKPLIPFKLRTLNKGVMAWEWLLLLRSRTRLQIDCQYGGL